MNCGDTLDVKSNITSYMVSQSINKENNGTINIVPNPVNSTSLITINISNNEDANIEIYNIFGKLIESHNKVNNNSSIKVNNSLLPKGVYTVKLIRSNGEISSSKMIVE